MPKSSSKEPNAPPTVPRPRRFHRCPRHRHDRVGVAAKGLITGKGVKDGSLTGQDIRDASVGGGKLIPGTIEAANLSAGVRESLQGPQGATGAQGPAGPGGGTTPVATFTNAGPITVADQDGSGAIPLTPTASWTTPAGAIDTVTATVQLSGASCVSNGPGGWSVSTDGFGANPWYEMGLRVKAGGTSSDAAVLARLGPGPHEISSLRLFNYSGCSIEATNILVQVTRSI